MASIAEEFKISDLFDTKTLDQPYVLKSVIVFTGAHYYSYIKEYNAREGKSYWLMFDDENLIQKLDSWQAVCSSLLDCSFVPTLILYEKQEAHNMKLN